MAEERIQKILARAGLGARRKCETLITEGRVKVNGVTVSALGEKADSERDEISVDGNPILTNEICYVMFNKPAGCLTTALPDQHGRATVMDYFEDFPVRVFPVGRLDFDTEGLLILTNDGAFTQQVLHPSHKVYKTYEAVVNGIPGETTLDLLRSGIELDDGITSPARVRLIGTRIMPPPVERNKRLRAQEPLKASIISISIREGRKRQVRRMFRAGGHEVLQLRRIRIGALDLGNLPAGAHKILTPEQAALALKEIIRD
ncbi:MAG: pseudouridine synthase [bacterium]